MMATTETTDVSYSAYSEGGQPPVAQPIDTAGAQPSSVGAQRSGITATLLTPNFILLAVAWLFSIIVFATAGNVAQGFTIFVGVVAFLASMFFIITLFFGDRMGPVGKYQHISLLFFGALWVLFYFVSGIVMAVNAFNSSGRAASAFSFLSVPVWGLLSYYAFKANSVPLPFGGRSSAQPTVSV